MSTVTIDTKKLAIASSLLAIALGASALGYSLASTSNTSTVSGAGTIEVSATAQQKGKPDTLNLQLTVTTTAKSAATALNNNNSKMAHLQSTFLSNGVTKSDLQTNGLDVGPTYNQKGAINGYSAEDDLGVTFHNIAKSGAIIDDAENAVGNAVAINSISFSMSNNSSLVQSTRKLAMKLARQKAQDFASGGSEQLGSIVRISQNQTSSSPSPLPMFNATAGAAKAAVPIQAGTQSVSVEVDVIYQLVG